MSVITADDFFAQVDRGEAFVIDVRSPDEFAACYIPGSINIPVEQIERGEGVKIPHDKQVYLLCRSGPRAKRAHQVLQSRGYTNIVCVDGGVMECNQVAGRVIWRSRVLPLMRQVQIAAGSLVLLGFFLSRFVHPAFIYLSVFVGAGLVFAGTTGFCGMAILLAKMPWNRLATSTCSLS